MLLLSDLHMASAQGPYGDPFPDDTAIAATLDWFATELAERTRLVILGDLFDFVLAPPHVRPGAVGDDLAAAKLEAIAAAHTRVFTALAAFAAAGHSLEILPGNHDIELLRPALQARLRELLGGAPLALHPWILHVPGVLYAEHGQQHHLLNHFVRLLDRSIAADDEPPPALGRSLDDLHALLATRLGRPLDDLGALWGATGRALLARQPGAAEVATDAIVGLWRLVRSSAALAYAGGGGHMTASLREASSELALPAEALVQILRCAQPTVRSAARSVRRARLAGPPAAPSHKNDASRADTGPDRYMLEAARTVDRVLCDHGVGVRFYAFGHTHVVRDAAVAARDPASGPPVSSGPRYLNPGTWSTLVRAGRERASDRLRLIEVVQRHPDPPEARWWQWNAATRRPSLLAGRPAPR